MKVVPVEIKGLALVELKVNGDARGFFIERFQQERFAASGHRIEPAGERAGSLHYATCTGCIQCADCG